MHPRSPVAGLLPSLRGRAFYKGLSLALAFCLVCPTVPAFAAESDEAALVHAEKIQFGSEVQSGDFAERLVRVEKRIFGRKKNGSDEERVERITSTLLIDRKKLKVTKKTEEKPSPAETSSEKQVEKPTLEITEKSGEIQPSAQAATEKTGASQDQSPSVSGGESASAPANTAKETVREIAKQFGNEFAKDETAQSAQTAKSSLNESATAALPENKVISKGKKKVGAKRGGKQQMTASNKAVEKKHEITLTPETAALDARKIEKPPSSQATYSSSSSSNRISRGPAHKVSQATALLREGLEAHKRGEEAKAEQLFKKVVLLEPRNPDGYFNLGALAEKKNDLAGALMSYRAALNLSPHDRELKEAVESVESQLGVEIAGSSPESEGAAYSSRSSGRTNNPSPSGLPSPREDEESRRAEIREYYARSGSGPQTAPNFYRARARTTREIQDEAAPFVDVNDPNAPMLSVSPPPAPVANTGQPQPFQLQTQRNQAAAQANQRKAPSTAGIATRAILGVALQVGTSYALRSTGLHCPVCRIGGGGGALRGLLRF